MIVVVTDSLAAAHVSAYGHERSTTPHFDAFAARGARFEVAYSQSAWTLPSVASLFTSLPQEQHALRALERSLPRDVPTLAERFRESGYRTVAWMQTPVLSSKSGLQRGFESYHVLDFSHASFDETLRRSREEWQDERDARPVFLYVHVTPPHMPYQPPAPFRGSFEPASSSAVDGSIASARAIHKAGLAPEHPDVRRLAALYDENIAFADARIGAWLAELEATPRGMDALAVWTSDHGEAFMQHGAQGHNSTVHEEMVRVPLAIASFEGEFSPRVVRTRVTLLDLAPTLIDWCALRAPLAEARGLSLVPLLRGGELATDERMVVLSSRYYDEGPRRLQLAALRGSFKLIWDVERDDWRLFDLAHDPQERIDLFAESQDEFADLQQALRAMHGARRTLADVFDGVQRSDEEDARHRESLRKLGYTDD